MRAWLKHLGSALRITADAAVAVLCWTLWLGLSVVLTVQIAVAFSHELVAPGFVLRAFEARLKATHVQARFGRATLDPAGGILVENLQLSLPEFTEPIAQANAVYIQLNPWALMAGVFEPRRIHVTGLKLYVPSMLSLSGKSEDIVQDLEMTLVPHNEKVEIEHLTGRCAGVAIALHGAYRRTNASRTGEVNPLPLIENLAAGYAPLMRQLVRLSQELPALESPQLDVELVPSPTAAAIANITLRARKVHVTRFHALTVNEITAKTRMPLLEKTPYAAVVSLHATEVRVGDVGLGTEIAANIRGTVTPTPFRFDPSSIEFRADDLSALGFSVQKLSGTIEPNSWTKFKVDLALECLRAGASIRADVDVTAATADVHFHGAVSPDLLTPMSAVIKKNVRRFVDFGAPVLLDIDARFGGGWKFERVAGHLDVQKVDAYGVPIDTAKGEIEFDGRHFLAHHAKATLGDNFATGSFYQDLGTREFRFLLEGRLRPLDISGWFREWWPNFFRDFEFPVVPPSASVDVAGRWFAGPETTVFVFADSSSPVIRGARFDHARTLLFIRPYFIDGLEAYGTRGAGDVRGTFVRHVNQTSGEWSELSLNFTSSIDLDAGRNLLGATLGAELDPYWFEKPPSVKVAGRFDGPGALKGSHQLLKILAESTGAFSAYKFPARNLTFEATLKDDELVLEKVRADVASGALTGRAVVSGPKAAKRLGFDAELHQASLGEAVTAVLNFAAQRRGDSQKPPDKILEEKGDVKLDLSLSADGLLSDPYSFQGGGNATLAGPSLGEIKLLGLLSDLLNFTALRFTNARAEFKVMGPKVTFPAVSITGSNSAIEGHGDYFLDRRELAFNARVYPFQESKSLFQNMVGVVLTPLSAVLEVKLTGPLDQPKWAFVIGPTNFFRVLSQPNAPSTVSPPPPPEPTPARNP